MCHVNHHEVTQAIYFFLAIIANNNQTCGLNDTSTCLVFICDDSVEKINYLSDFMMVDMTHFPTCSPEPIWLMG